MYPSAQNILYYDFHKLNLFFKIQTLPLQRASSPIGIYQEIAYLIDKKSFQAKFSQLFSIEEYFALLSYAKFKKKHTFLPENDQLSIVKLLNRKFGNLMIFFIN